MALVLISVVLSMISGCIVWLALGERFPVGEVDKWPATNNIVCYSVIALPVIYLAIFFTF